MIQWFWYSLIPQHSILNFYSPLISYFFDSRHDDLVMWNFWLNYSKEDFVFESMCLNLSRGTLVVTEVRHHGWECVMRETPTELQTHVLPESKVNTRIATPAIRYKEPAAKRVRRCQVVKGCVYEGWSRRWRAVMEVNQASYIWNDRTRMLRNHWAWIAPMVLSLSFPFQTIAISFPAPY